MNPKDIKVKLGDKYAVIDNGLSRGVSGPYYVTGIRGSLVSLDSKPEPNPKATRGWRAGGDGTLRQTVRWSYSRAVPWTKEHDESKKKQNLIFKVSSALETQRSKHFEDLSIHDLSTILALLTRPKEATDDTDRD